MGNVYIEGLCNKREVFGMEWDGKKVVVFYDDKQNVSRKHGVFLRETDNLVFLREGDGSEIAIPTSRIIRIELNG